MIYLYIVFEMVAGGTMHKLRVPQPDMETRLRVLETSKTKIKKDRTEGVAISCGLADIEMHVDGEWISGRG